MLLKGSCHCGAVQFTVQSRQPYPFNLCYCSICRKTTGCGGFAINIKGDFKTLEVHGREHVKIYRAKLQDGKTSTSQRNFCGACGSHLWIWDEQWPEMVFPAAAAIDTPLPVPAERVHLMLGSKASWVVPNVGPKDKTFDEYPDESIDQWHTRLGLNS